MAVLVVGAFMCDGMTEALGFVFLGMISVAACVNKRNLSGVFWYSEITVQLL